jgi:hypothetical protein
VAAADSALSAASAEAAPLQLALDAAFPPGAFFHAASGAGAGAAPPPQLAAVRKVAADACALRARLEELRARHSAAVLGLEAAEAAVGPAAQQVQAAADVLKGAKLTAMAAMAALIREDPEGAYDRLFRAKRQKLGEAE